MRSASGTISKEKPVMTGKRRWGEVMATAAGLMITLSAAMVLAIILIFLLSDEPGRTIYYFLAGPFTNRY